MQPSNSLETVPGNKQRYFGYRVFVILLGIIIIGLPWLFISYQIHSDYDRTIESASRETMNLAKAFEQHVQEIVSDADKDLNTLKTGYESDGVSHPIFAVYEEIAARDKSRNLVAVYNEKGIIIKSYIQNALGTDGSNREYFQFHRYAATKEMFIGKVIKAKLDGFDVIPLSRRINKPDGSFGGIVFIGLSVDYFLHYLEAIELGQDRLISLTGLDGFNRARRAGDAPAREQGTRSGMLWRSVQNGLPNNSFITDAFGDNVKRIVSFREMPDYPLIISVGQSTQVALADYERRKRGYVLVTSLFSAIFLVFCIVLVNREEKLRSQKVILSQINTKLVDSSEQYRALVENSPDCISRLDRQGRRLYVNQAWMKFAPGLSREEIVGMKSEEIGMPTAHCTMLNDAIERVLSNGKAVQKTFQLCNNGDAEYYDWRLVPEYDSSGSVSTVLSLSRNITNDIMIKRQLEESEQLYRNLVDTACAIIMTTNSRGEILYMNNFGLEFFGYRAEELIGRTFYETIIPEYESTGRNLHREIAARGPKVEVPHYVHENILRSGKRVWVDWSNRVYLDPITGDQNLLGVGIDIHERKLMEEELKRHRDNLQGLVEQQVAEICQINAEMAEFFSSISDPFFVLDREGHLVYMNREVKQFDPRLNEIYLGRSIWDVFPEHVLGELFNKFQEACDAKRPVHIVVKNSDKVFDGHLYPYTKGLLVYMRDVTEQKRYEAELMRLDRLNIVGEMAAGIGHEIRNPLTTVRGYLQLFMQKEKYAEHRAQFTTMIEELDRANAIITEYLSLAKNKTVELKPGNMNSIFDALFPLLQAEAYHSGHSLQVQMHTTPDILLNGSELRQMILNLVRNGFEAMQSSGKVTLKSYVEADKVVVAVMDTGKGIPHEVMDKLGTPFFTTKDNGTGLGLAVCYRIAERHGAKIEVDTSESGTTFAVKFPI